MRGAIVDVIWIMLAIAMVSICFYTALRLTPRMRLVVLVVLASAATLISIQVPPHAKIVRFCVALMVAIAVLKMWDLHLGVAKGGRPNFREFLVFLGNLYFLTWRRRGAERQPTVAKNILDLIIGIVGLAVTVGGLAALLKTDRSAFPFLLEHTLFAIGLFLFLLAELKAWVAVTRLLGGYIVDANNWPLVARTPADFWRRYNRLIGQFLHEDVFKPMEGRRHPVRATLAVFAVSGLLHEYLYWIAIGRSPGLQMLFFMLQGCAVVLTMRIKPTGWRALAWGIGTLGFNILSSIPFFASFHHMIPIYQNGLPGWLHAW